MRFNVKKIACVGGLVVVIWFIVTYYSKFKVPKLRSSGNINVIEERIQRLEKDMDSQLGEITKLLDRVKSHLKTESVDKEHLGDDFPNIEFKENDLEDRGDDMKAQKQVSKPAGAGLVLPVLVIACDRVTVSRCLDNLVKFRPSKETFPIIVSQDCNHQKTYQVIESFTKKDPSIKVVKQPDQSVIKLPPAKVKFRGYYNIARHYKFALNHVFNTLGHEAVIIVEDDLDISPDFFEYFQGTYPLLLKDPSLWCISAWNDNGKKSVIELSRPELLHRTDFFPGLGWLLRSDSWTRLEDKWPPAFFDDWLRNPQNTDNKACIRPEVSRTYSFGKIGVSKGLFFETHLKHMTLNTNFVEFTKLDLSYLLKSKYDKEFELKVYESPLVTVKDLLQMPAGNGEAVRVGYMDARSFQKAARALGLMDDFRSGIPRTAYRGIVTCFFQGRRVYLAPNFIWTKYDPKWG